MTSYNDYDKTQPFYLLLSYREGKTDSATYYTHFDLEPAWLADDGSPRRLDSYNVTAKGFNLESFKVSASMICRQGKENDAYVSWEHGYTDAWRINLAKAEAMVKVLKAIDTHLNKATQRDGQPASFGQYILRICRALGAAGILIEDEDSRRHGQRTSYWTRTDGSVVDHIDYQVMWAKQRAKEAFKPAEVLV